MPKHARNRKNPERKENLAHGKPVTHWLRKRAMSMTRTAIQVWFIARSCGADF